MTSNEIGAESTSLKTPDIERMIATRLRFARRGRSLTLAEVANGAGISLGYLSRLEAGDRQPSVGTLVVLAKVLGIGLSELLAEPPSLEELILRKNTQPTHSRPEGVYTHLSGSLPEAVFEMLECDLKRSKRPVSSKSHSGEEWIYVLEGTVDLLLDGEEHQLETGDAAHFLAKRLHRVTSNGPHARILLAISAHESFGAH